MVQGIAVLDINAGTTTLGASSGLIGSIPNFRTHRCTKSHVHFCKNNHSGGIANLALEYIGTTVETPSKREMMPHSAFDSFWAVDVFLLRPGRDLPGSAALIK